MKDEYSFVQADRGRSIDWTDSERGVALITARSIKSINSSFKAGFREIGKKITKVAKIKHR